MTHENVKILTRRLAEVERTQNIVVSTEEQLVTQEPVEWVSTRRTNEVQLWVLGLEKLFILSPGSPPGRGRWLFTRPRPVSSSPQPSATLQIDTSNSDVFPHSTWQTDQTRTPLKGFIKPLKSVALRQNRDYRTCALCSLEVLNINQLLWVYLVFFLVNFAPKHPVSLHSIAHPLKLLHDFFFFEFNMWIQSFRTIQSEIHLLVIFLFDSFSHQEQWVSCLCGVAAFAATCWMFLWAEDSVCLQPRHHWALTLKIYLCISSSSSVWWGQCWCCDRKLLTWSRCKDKRPPPTQLQTVDDCSNNCRHVQDRCEDEEVPISLIFKGNWNSKNNTHKTSVFQENINRHSRCQTRYISYSNISTCCQVNPRPQWPNSATMNYNFRN